ncbi:MAG TPA: DMT family transporter [Myxococcales bacterium]|nr:DMT family transporter [Myxococcales bacterium]
MPRPSLRDSALTVASLICFAANSLLCRMALRPGLIDAPSFMNIRFASGAIVLALLAGRNEEGRGPLREGTFRGALWLAFYAVTFSFAYLRLPAGAGALILFGVVQLTMTGWGLLRGERPAALEWLGHVLAFTGLLVLTLPGLSAPDPRGALLMTCAGIGWAFYSLHGRAAKSAVASNAGHFIRALPFTLAVSAITIGSAHLQLRGVLLALASGVLASGLGYVIWYSALKSLSSTQAGIVQLAVPAIAAAGGVLLLGEALSPRLLGAGAAILIGILVSKLSH